MEFPSSFSNFSFRYIEVFRFSVFLWRKLYGFRYRYNNIHLKLIHNSIPTQIVTPVQLYSNIVVIVIIIVFRVCFIHKHNSRTNTISLPFLNAQPSSSIIINQIQKAKNAIISQSQSNNQFETRHSLFKTYQQQPTETVTRIGNTSDRSSSSRITFTNSHFGYTHTQTHLPSKATSTPSSPPSYTSAKHYKSTFGIYFYVLPYFYFFFQNKSFSFPYDITELF